MGDNHGGISLVSFRNFFLSLIFSVWRSTLYNNAFYLMLNNIITSLLGFVFWNIMSRFYPPAEVGIGAALVSASMLIGALANMGLGNGLIRFVPEVGKKTGLLLNTVFIISGIAAMVGSLVYLAGIGRWSPALSFIRENIMLIVMFVIFTAATTVSFLTDQSLVAGRTAYYVFYKNLIISLIKMFLPVLIFINLDGYGIFAGTGMATLIGILLSWCWFLPSVFKGYIPQLVWAGDIMKKVLPYSFGNYLGNLLGGIPGSIYPLMVLNFLGPEESAYLYIAWMMTMVLSVIPNGLAQSLFAEGSYDPGRLSRDGRKIMLLALVISIPAVALMIVLGGWFLHFFGPGYAESGTGVIRYLALAIIPQCVISLYITVNQVRKQIFLIIAQTGILSIIALGLGYWLLGVVGLPGVGMAYTTAHLIVAMVVAWPLSRVLRENVHGYSQ